MRRAQCAAQRATDAGLQGIQHRYDATTNAESDREFQLAIAEATHNVVLLYIMRGLLSLLLDSILSALGSL